MTNRNQLCKGAVDLTGDTTLKKPMLKKQKLRNNEYYEMQCVFDELYAKSVEGKIFTGLMKVVMDENNILLAYRNIKNNKGSETVGTDGRLSTTKTGRKKNLSTIFKANLETTSPRVCVGWKYRKSINPIRHALLESLVWTIGLYSNVFSKC
jgi:hypothetical protein